MKARRKKNRKDNPGPTTSPAPEICGNPFQPCQSTDISLYIYFKDEKVPICRECWNSLAEKKEW